MDIVIRNCNNIDFGSIHVQEGCLNIKYAANGTGKSTIANAIALWGSGQPLTSFLPYKYTQQENPTEEQLPTLTNLCPYCANPLPPGKKRTGISRC